MKAQSQKTNKRSIILSLLTLLIIVGIGFASVYATTGSFLGWKPFNSESKVNDEQIDNGKTIKENSVENGQSGSDAPIPPKDDGEGKRIVEVDIVSVNTVSNIVKVSTLISALDQEGTCKLTVTGTDGMVLYSTDTGVQPMSNTSTCKGFDIPSNLLTSNYTIAILFTSGDLYGSSSYEVN